LTRAVIFGCAGPTLSAAERDFFRDADPLGFILFARNIVDPAQVRSLVAALREAVGRDAPVLIDQEGGRVQRLRPPHWRAAPAAARLAALPDPAAERAVWINARLIAAELADLGIDVDCAPVLDVPVPGAHGIIGDRAYGADPARVARLGAAAVAGLLAGGVLPVIKHLPGHGRAQLDSHEACPVVTDAAATLEADLAPFAALADAPFAMTAHVVYTAWDAVRVATTSTKVIAEVIRGRIGFDGALMSDDLSMKALGGSFGDRARAAQEAGCDLVLHCNGDPAEMTEIAAATAPLAGKAAERVARALKRRQAPDPADLPVLRAELDALLAGTAP
jgi:beta-N-acetylhexosaminidase